MHVVIQDALGFDSFPLVETIKATHAKLAQNLSIFIKFLTVADRVQIIGNLPFNISTKLLTDWISMVATDANAVGSFHDVLRNISRLDLVLMFQKEVAAVFF